MAAGSHDKEDLSVDNVHTPFGLTKQPPATSPHSKRTEVRIFIASSQCHVARSPPTHEEVYDNHDLPSEPREEFITAANSTQRANQPGP
ncbi:hypothetical protein GCM10010052_19810 [Paenarthrobacter histidinolovorans]|nr:hypothetical protein GCM10010052_19810 [Paenarthrobacter histidinolovorans]